MPIARRVIPEAQLLKTGQITQYDSELDDGYYQKGVAKAYSILTAGQYSGACVFTLDGKTETQSNNCVLDLNTGKMWARYTSAESASVGPSADGEMPWTGTDDDIFQYCAAANAVGLGGHSDWRIPNDEELAGLRNMEPSTAVPDTTAFPGWPTSHAVWTSTCYPVSASANAQQVDFAIGRIAYVSKTTNRLVALVRGGI